MLIFIDRSQRDDDEGQDYIMRISLGYEEASLGGYEIRLIDDQSTPTITVLTVSDKLDQSLSVWFLIPVPVTYAQLRL